MREGDVLVVQRADRVARTPAELLRLVDGLTKRRVDLVVMSVGGQKIDTREPGWAPGPLMTAIRGVAAWERSVRLERQRVGIRRGQAAGSHRSPADRRAGADRQAAGGDRPGSGIGRTSVWRALGPGYRVERAAPRDKREPINARLVQVLLAAGMGPTEVSRQVGCSRSSVRRLGGLERQRDPGDHWR
jgi:DNA invertase Pin-like site-specific DNA recombinase